MLMLMMVVIRMLLQMSWLRIHHISRRHYQRVVFNRVSIISSQYQSQQSLDICSSTSCPMHEDNPIVKIKQVFAGYKYFVLLASLSG